MEQGGRDKVNHKRQFSIILEHAAVACDTSTLLVLRQVCLNLKQKADLFIGNSSHLPMPEETYEKIGPDGEMLSFTVRELSISKRKDHDDIIEESISFEEGWSIDLTTLDAAITETLSYADPGGQLSWAEYDPELAWELMMEKRWVDFEDFASDREWGDDDDEPKSPETGWRVRLEVWTDSCSRMDILQVVRSIIQDYRGDSESDNSESESDADKEHGEDEGADGVCVSIFLRVWGLLLKVPQKLVHVRISYDYRHTDLPSRCSDEYVFIRTSQNKDYQLKKSSGFQRL